MKKALFHRSFLFPLGLIASLLTAGCDRIGGVTSPGPEFKTEYQAVFLDNGQVFFGKIENAGSNYPLLKDVFYVQSMVEEKGGEKKEVRNILVKRGSEWHGPDRMYINSRHIVLIEPVAPASKVGELIKEAVKKTGAK